MSSCGAISSTVLSFFDTRLSSGPLFYLKIDPTLWIKPTGAAPIIIDFLASVPVTSFIAETIEPRLPARMDLRIEGSLIFLRASRTWSLRFITIDCLSLGSVELIRTDFSMLLLPAKMDCLIADSST